jgi:outer membrane protein assembly factor BamD (BamD/ComL family)
MILTTISLVLFAAQSRVELLDGSKVVGEISDINLNAVTIVVAGSEDATVIANKDILEVFPETTEVMRQAQASLDALDFQNAKNSFDEAAEKSEEGYMKSFAELHSAETLIAWAEIDDGQYTDAIKLLNAWVSENSSSFWLPRAQMSLARALANNRDIDGAASLMEKLTNMAFDKNLARHIELEASVIRCEVFLIGGQAQAAQNRLSSLKDTLGGMIRDSETPSALRRKARGLHSQVQIFNGRAIQEIEGVNASQTYWKELADSELTAPVVRSAAWLGLAEAAMDANQLRSAQLQLAKIVAVMPSSPNVTPQALYKLAVVSASLEDTKSSRSAAMRLTTNYPNSTWAIKASSEGL